MKKEINLLRLLLIAVGAIAVVIAAAFIFAGNQVDYDELIQVRIKTMGTMVPNGSEYKLTLENDTWVASYNDIDWFVDNIKETSVDEDFANNIKEILKENEAHKWNDFSLEYEIRKKLSTIATDGVNYSFYMCFSDGSIVKLEEYNFYPETYMAVLSGFKEQYKSLFNE